MTETITDLLADIEPVVRGWIGEQIGANANSNDPGDQFEFEFTNLADGQIIYYDGDSLEWINTSRSGGNNIYIGAGAGAAMTSTVNAVFIGVQSGESNTTADGNTFVGYYSGRLNVDGWQNAFFGMYSGEANLDDLGTFIGFYAGSANTLGTGGTFVGALAGGGNTIGNYNVDVGVEANYLNQEGSAGVYLGYQAGRGAGVHNKSGGVFIGYQAGYSEVGSNKLYIENSNSATPLIYGEFDNRLVRFNAASVEILYAADAEAQLIIKSQSNDDGDVVGSVNFWGYSDGSNYRQYAGIDGVIFQKDDGSEEGQLDFDLISSGGIGSRLTFTPAAFTFHQTTSITTSAGDLRLHANGSIIVGQQTQFDDFVIIDNTSTEALLVRKNADGGDVFVVNSTIPGATVYGATLIDGSADVVQLTVQAHSTQNANLQDWEDSSGNVMGGVDGDGQPFCTLNTGSDNVFYAGGGNTTMTANSNICIGAGAGEDITSGIGRNVFIGKQAGTNNTTGSDNFALGEGSLFVCTDGYQNVAIGQQALYNNLHGHHNTAIGSNALLECSFNGYAHFNTAVGNSSGLYNRTGNYNTYVGYNAGFGVSNNSHSNNTFVGADSANAITTGSHNTAIGFEAGKSLTTGSSNVLIGVQAGDLLTVGVTNIIIGSFEDPPFAGINGQINIGGVFSGERTNNTAGINVISTSIAAQFHVDQSAADGSRPVILLDQGDASEQAILISYGGADVDMTIIELDVDGAPKFGWSETPNVFTLNKGLAISDNNELRLHDNGNYVGFEAPALSEDQIWVLPTADGAEGSVLSTDGSGTLQWDSNASEKTWAFMSRDANTGTNYIGGYYKFETSDNDFNPSVTFGTANASYAAHFFLVQAAGGGGGTDTVIRVTGTTIDDQGNRSAATSVDITVDDAGSAGDYYETSEKWIGQVTIEKQSGPDLLCNYGFCKYWDNNNSDFKITGFEATWLGAKNDATPNIIIRHHKATGWIYNNGAAPTPPSAISDMATDHNTEIQIRTDEEGAWKRDNLSTVVSGSSGEGTIIELLTTTNRTYAIGNFIVRIVPQ